MVSTLALHPSQPLKAWAGHVHRALRNLAPAPAPHPSQPGGAGPGLPPFATVHGFPCLVQQATHLLTDMWQSGQPADQQSMPTHHLGAAMRGLVNSGIDQAPLTWLGRFHPALQALRVADKQSEQGQDRALSSQQNEVMRMILTALLDHPLLEVQAAAAETCADAVLALPIEGISLLPLLLHRLQLSVAVTQQGESLMHACLVMLSHA